MGFRAGLLVIVAVMSGTAAETQRTGTVERIRVHGKSLEGNLSSDSADRDVSVYLPPSYKAESQRRYPVVYMLHGFTDDDARWFGVVKHWISFPAVIDKALANQGNREMIFVMPNAFTRFQGSMYSSSVTTGDWETFVARELVAWIDSHYRTIPSAASRGLAGHSMGGFGTLRIGFKHPDVFSSLYALSPCCLNQSVTPRPAAAKAVAITDPAEIAKADFLTKATLASAAAWSPDPENPPLYVELPWKDGEFQPAVAAKWAANSPLTTLDQLIPEVRRLKAIAFDAGEADAMIAASIRTLDSAMTKYRIAHTFEIYTGNHTDHIAERIEMKMVPFFSTHLSR